jgi:uncharacterized coiled-coil protein SlyX
MESRLVELEVRYTHLAQELAELNQVVFEQQKTISYLKNELAAVRGKIESLGDPVTNDPPPHY